MTLRPAFKRTTDLGDLTEPILINLRSRGCNDADLASLRPALSSLFALRSAMCRLPPSDKTTALNFPTTEQVLKDYYEHLCAFEEFHLANKVLDERPGSPGGGGAQGVVVSFTWSNSLAGLSTKPSEEFTSLSSINFEKANVLFTLAAHQAGAVEDWISKPAPSIEELTAAIRGFKAAAYTFELVKSIPSAADVPFDFHPAALDFWREVTSAAAQEKLYMYTRKHIAAPGTGDAPNPGAALEPCDLVCANGGGLKDFVNQALCVAARYQNAGAVLQTAAGTGGHATACKSFPYPTFLQVRENYWIAVACFQRARFTRRMMQLAPDVRELRGEEIAWLRLSLSFCGKVDALNAAARTASQKYIDFLPTAVRQLAQSRLGEAEQHNKDLSFLGCPNIPVLPEQNAWALLVSTGVNTGVPEVDARGIVPFSMELLRFSHAKNHPGGVGELLAGGARSPRRASLPQPLPFPKDFYPMGLMELRGQAQGLLGARCTKAQEIASAANAELEPLLAAARAATAPFEADQTGIPDDLFRRVEHLQKMGGVDDLRARVEALGARTRVAREAVAVAMRDLTAASARDKELATKHGGARWAAAISTGRGSGGSFAANAGQICGALEASDGAVAAQAAEVAAVWVDVKPLLDQLEFIKANPSRAALNASVADVKALGEAPEAAPVRAKAAEEMREAEALVAANKAAGDALGKRFNWASLRARADAMPPADRVGAIKALVDELCPLGEVEAAASRGRALAGALGASVARLKELAAQSPAVQERTRTLCFISGTVDAYERARSRLELLRDTVEGSCRNADREATSARDVCINFNHTASAQDLRINGENAAAFHPPVAAAYLPNNLTAPPPPPAAHPQPVYVAPPGAPLYQVPYPPYVQPQPLPQYYQPAPPQVHPPPALPPQQPRGGAAAQPATWKCPACTL
jgi:hypothetical protein